MTNETLLNRGVLEVIDANHIRKRLERGEKLRVKLGIDPSTADLHIGHAVPLKKLREFQDAGHMAVLIIGDYTAQIGDPTGRSEARVMLTPEQVKANAEGYLEQAYKILDRDKTEVHYQSEWFNDFSLRDTIELMATTTANHLLSHETFKKRLDDNQPLFSHELLYPLLQGYDSVMVKADLELGGIDQKFNVLMGRLVQRAHNQSEQDVMLFPYLPGIDGQAKMSKSLNNTINLNDSPENMFGKVMSIPDLLIAAYFDLATSLSGEEIASLDASTPNPRDLKERLAKQIVTEYYSPDAAEAAAQAFSKVFRQKEAPETVEVLKLAPGAYDLVDILVQRTTLLSSRSEFRRLIEQKGITKNKIVLSDPAATVSPTDGPDVMIRVGPRRFLKIEWKDSHGV